MNAMLTGVSTRIGVNPREAVRFIKFAIVGAIGFIVDFGVFNLLVGPFDTWLAEGGWLYNLLTGFGLSAELMPTLAPAMAGTVSFVCAIVSNFLWNRYWTYPDSRSKSRRRQFAMFVVVSLIGILIRIPIITLLHGPCELLVEPITFLAPYAERIGDNLALAVSVVVVMFWNFFANRYWTYNDVD